MGFRKFISGVMAVSMLTAASVTASAEDAEEYMKFAANGAIEWELGSEGANIFEGGHTYYFINNSWTAKKPETGIYLELRAGSSTSYLSDGSPGGTLRLRSSAKDGEDPMLVFTAPANGTLVVDSHWEKNYWVNIYTSDTTNDDSTYVNDVDTDKRYTKVSVTAGKTYYLWCGANTTLVDKITFTPSVTTTSPKYFSFGVPSAAQANGEAATYTKVKVNIVTAGAQNADGIANLSSAITLTEGAEVAIKVTDVPSYVTINSVELQ